MINPDWKGETVVIIASGTSVTQQDLDLVKQHRKDDKCKVIAINANYAYADYADIVYFCDYKFYKWHKDKSEFQNHRARKISICPQETEGVEKLKQGNEYGLSRQHDTLNTGSNSGFQCINLAYLLGVSRIVLLGYDMKIADNGRSHHHPDHPQPLSPIGYKKIYDDILDKRLFETVAFDLHNENISVINCSPISAISCFRKLPLTSIRFH